MKDITLEVVKIDVYHEVQKVTAYVGQRMPGDADAYERINSTDADMELFEAYWTEACSQTLDLVKEFVVSASGNGRDPSLPTSLEVNLNVSLSVPSNYDETLTDSLQTSLTNYFINYILSRWFAITNKQESQTVRQCFIVVGGYR